MNTSDVDALAVLWAVTRFLRWERRASADGAAALPKLFVLAALEECGKLDLEALASEELVQGPTMVETLKPLIQSGWVRRRPDTTDRRRVRLELTSVGREMLRSEQKRLNFLLEGLTSAEVKTLIRATAVLRSITYTSLREGK